MHFQVTEQYDTYNYGSVLQLAEKFVNSEISGFYLHIIKDR